MDSFSPPSSFFLALLLSVVAGIIAIGVAYRRLRARHLDTWRSIGAPGVLGSTSPTAQLRVWQFIWRREYLRLDDARLTRSIAIAKLFAVVSTLLFLGSIIASFFTEPGIN